MADRQEMFGPNRGFSGIADSIEPCKMLWGRALLPACQLSLHAVEGYLRCVIAVCRSFVGINPQRGTKAARRTGKKMHSIHPKVLSFANALRDFTSEFAL